MKKIIICIFMMFSFCAISAQEIQREGNTFTQVTKSGSREPGKETQTKFTYTDSKGNVYPVYLSSTGKAYVKKVSKRTGREYKCYIPEIGKQINPSAYKDKEK